MNLDVDLQRRFEVPLAESLRDTLSKAVRCAQAIEQDGLRPQNISFYLNAMSPFPGAAGETTFDNDGNARKFHRMFVIEGGQAVRTGQ